MVPLTQETIFFAFIWHVTPNIAQFGHTIEIKKTVKVTFPHSGGGEQIP